MTYKKTKHLETLSRWMDTRFRLPGGIRFGLDSVIGLIPGVGDFVTGTLSLYALREAHRLGAPKSVMWRIVLNTLIDSVLGSIPIIGDVFDLFWKSNVRNLNLLRELNENPEQTRKQSLWFTATVLVAVALLVALSIYIFVIFVSAVFRALFGA